MNANEQGDKKIVPLTGPQNKEIFQVLVCMAGREQPIGLAFRKLLDAQKIASRLSLVVPENRDTMVEITDDFGHMLHLISAPQSVLVIQPEKAVDMNIELGLIQARGQAKGQMQAQSDPMLRAAHALTPSGLQMPRG